MIKGKLADGYEYEVLEEARDDWEIIEAIEEYETKPQKIVVIARKLLGDEGYNKLKEACRVDGRVAFTTMAQKVFEILQDCGETKN